MYETALFWAVMLARDVDACRALLAGEPVDPARLDPEWLETARTFHFVTLDVIALDLLPRIQYVNQQKAHEGEAELAA